MNNRWRQKKKAIFDNIKRTPQVKPLLAPADLAAADWKKAIQEAIERDYEQMKNCVYPEIWSDPIAQLVMYGTIDSGVKK